MEWHLFRQWVSHHGSRHVHNGLTISPLHWTASAVCSDYDEVHLVFDRYNLPTSDFTEGDQTRERPWWQPATAYHMANTPVGMVSAKQSGLVHYHNQRQTDNLSLSCKQSSPLLSGKSKVFIVTSRQELRADSENAIETFVCQLYEPGTLRWMLVISCGSFSPKTAICLRSEATIQTRSFT